MTREQLTSGDSFIHRLNPKTRVVSAVFLSILAAVGDDILFSFIYLSMALILIWMACLPAKKVFGRMKPVFLFLLMIWLIIPVSYPGEPVFRVSFLSFSRSGLMMCALISIKSAAILLYFTALVATMNVAVFANTLQQLHMPDKMVFILTMSYRYISVIETEYRRLRRAAAFRGFQSGTSLHSYRTFAYLAGMLFVRASMRANRVYQAMICRGFNKTFQSLELYTRNKNDTVFLLGALAIGTSLFIFENIRM